MKDYGYSLVEKSVIESQFLSFFSRNPLGLPKIKKTFKKWIQYLFWPYPTNRRALIKKNSDINCSQIEHICQGCGTDMIDNERMPLSHQANRHRYNENNDYDLFEADDIKKRDDDRFLKSKFVYQLKPNIKQ